MARSAVVGWRAKTGAWSPLCTPKAICVTAITAATANAASGYLRRGITVAASRTVTAVKATRPVGPAWPAATWGTLVTNSTAASKPSACHG